MLALLLLIVASGAPASQPAAHAAEVNSRNSAGAPAAASALDLLTTGIGKHRFVLLGETHGTREIPALTGDLVARYASAGEPVVLALEIDSREQQRFDRYLASRGKNSDSWALLAGDHWQHAMHDGRDSAAMFALIERVRALRTERRDVSIVLFDRYAEGEGDRDARMADALRDAIAQRSKARVIVLTGNIHAMVRVPESLLIDGKPIVPPVTAGRRLSDLRPFSIAVSALAGESVICQRGVCSIQPFRGSGAAHAPIFEPDSADSPWDATLTLPKFTPSRPAIVDQPSHSTR